MNTTAVEQPRTRSHSFYPATRLLIAILIVMQGLLCWIARDRSLKGDVDLRAFYAAGSIVRQGYAAHLYDPAFTAQTQKQLFGESGRTLPFLYPAVAALPFIPLSLLPYRAAFVVFLFINVALLYVSAYLLRSMARSTFSARGMFALFLCFLPTSIVLMQGQISCVLLVIFASLCLLAERGCMFIAGLCLSLALVKFQFVLPIVVLLVLWRQWRLVSGFFLGALGMACLSLLLTGTQGAKAYLACLQGLGASMLRDPASARMHYGMQTAAEPNLHGFMTTMAGSGPISTLLLLGGSVLVLVCAARSCRTIASAIPAAMLVSYHMQPYDLLLLLVPLVASFNGAPARQLLSQDGKVPLLIASILLLTAPIALYLILHGETVWFVFAVCGIFAWGQEHLNKIMRTPESYEERGEPEEAFA